jgi:hypothetical protein
LGNSLLNLFKHFRYALCMYTSSVCLENVSKQSTKNTKAKIRGYFHVNVYTVRITVTLIIVGMFVLRVYMPAKIETYTKLLLTIRNQFYIFGYYMCLFAV